MSKDVIINIIITGHRTNRNRLEWRVTTFRFELRVSGDPCVGRRGSVETVIKRLPSMGKIITIYSFPNIVSTDKVKVEATKEVKLKFKIRVVGLRNKRTV